MKKVEIVGGAGVLPCRCKVCPTFTSISLWFCLERVMSSSPTNTSPLLVLTGGCNRKTCSTKGHSNKFSHFMENHLMLSSSESDTLQKHKQVKKFKLGWRTCWPQWVVSSTLGAVVNSTSTSVGSLGQPCFKFWVSTQKVPKHIARNIATKRYGRIKS